jgi:hypothetical protein
VFECHECPKPRRRFHSPGRCHVQRKRFPSRLPNPMDASAEWSDSKHVAKLKSHGELRQNERNHIADRGGDVQI